ncbi:MAG: precorrin-6y C5,15-methyltransferase (decarboxylating) subunit CbiE [Deltaproteobacteria bacterium]|nr:precorrin-6y C5,15-methyltransferase (decarboxylating) subunit CbiE [Deltaproteobacteria bacterium]
MAITKDKIMIVGCGPGSPDYLTSAARSAIPDADVLIGAERLLALFPGGGAERIAVGTDTEKIVEEIARRRSTVRIAVLVTGDPGLYSLASLIIRRFGRAACEIVPGVSAVQAAFARIGLCWQNAKIISIHAAEPNLRSEELCANETIALLGGGEKLSRLLLPLFGDLEKNGYRLFACEDLTLPEERISEINADSLTGRVLSTRTVILIIRKELLL